MHCIIHCAADIRLEVHIHDTLQANYQGTRNLLNLATACNHLRALIHVSTAYVNVNLPKGCHIDEVIYPLMEGGQQVDEMAIAEVRTVVCII